ncbi:hypothetical protein BGZ58_006667 [Dissophora ornata]|nr:hypothetical protein BGZ58_006667 [Dissophora ornata]
MVQALDLPELREYVGQFLDERDMAVCLCVCRDWYGTFMPLRWRNACIIGVHSIRADVNLRKHAQYVRSLSLLQLTSLKHLTCIERYNHLERMHISKADIDGRVIWEKVALLAEQNVRTLRTMLLEDMMPLRSFLLDLGDFVEGHLDAEEDEDEEERMLKLKEMTWKRVAVFYSSMEAFWNACKGAETLVFECLMIKGWDLLAPKQTTPALESQATTRTRTGGSGADNGQLSSSHSCRVQNLRVAWTIDLPLAFQLSLWIQPCTQLRSLIWEAYAFPEALLSQFAKLLRDNTWPFLTSIEMASCITQYPPDHAIAEVLQASPNLFEKLVFKNMDFGPLAFNSLRRHFPSLKTLMWLCCGVKVTSAMAREVLESCTRLEALQAPYLLMDGMATSSSPSLAATTDVPEGQERVKVDEQERELEDDKALDPSLPPSLILPPSPSSQPWVCLELHTLYIESALSQYMSPPLSKADEEAILERLKALKKLRNYCVGSSISSASRFFPK